MSFFQTVFDLVNKGGSVSWILLAFAIWLWYALGYRFFILQNASGGDFLEAHGGLSAFRQPIRSIVMVAPLLGLLGTVIGMIETFSSLQDQAMYSQTGGIAGGISQALVTTQMGLMVAIPGLIVGRQLDRKQNDIQNQMEVFQLAREGR